MTTIITRAGKGLPLTNAEMDANLINLNTDKLEVSSNLSDVGNITTARQNLSAAKDGVNSDITSLQTLSSIGGGSPGGYRNYILNGAMNVSQKATTFNSPVSGDLLLDRWRWLATNNTSTVQVSQVTDSTLPNNFQNSLRVLVTNPDTAVSNNEYVMLRTKIPSQHTASLVGKPFTLSFYVKSSKPGIYCVNFTNNGTSTFLPVEYTINSANVWERKTITVSGGLSAGYFGTPASPTAMGLNLSFILCAGSNFHGTNNTWSNGVGTWYSTSNQVNFFDTDSNTFFLTGVQLELGTVASEFEHRSFFSELQECQSFYERGYFQWSGTTTAANFYSGYAPFKATKYGTVSVTLTNTNVVNGINSGSITFSPEVGLSSDYEGAVVAFSASTTQPASILSLRWAAEAQAS